MDRPRKPPEPPAIDITWVSCRGVRSSLPFHTPCLYASVCVTSSAGKNRRSHRVRTPTDRAGGENPEWEDERLRLHLPDDASSPASEQEAEDDGVLVVRFELKAEVAVFPDVLAASAVVPLPDLVADGTTRRVSYQLAAPSDGRQPNGVISFSYVFHDGSNDGDHDEDRRSDGEPVTPPCQAPLAPVSSPAPLAPVSYGMYPMIDDWPSMEQLAPLMEQNAVYPPPLTVTGSRYYHASTPSVQLAAIYPPPSTRKFSSAGGIYPTVWEQDNGLYPTVDLAPVSCYPPPTAPYYGRGFEYPAAPDWDTRCLYG